MPENALKNVAAKYHLTPQQVSEILALLDSGFSIPYVLRYHKELAAGLQADDFYELIEERRRVEKLEARRRKILKKLAERDILTEDLEARINQARDLRELIDIYVPFRPRKRSRSRQALSQGLEPLARQVFAREEFIPDMAQVSEQYVDPEVGLDSVESVLEGVFHIVSDWLAEDKAHRERQRGVFRQDADIVVGRAARSLPARLAREFRTYFEFREKVAKLHPYHMLTILRGKRMKVLQYSIEAPVAAMSRAAAALYLPGGAAQLESIEAEVGVEGLSADPAHLKVLNSIEFLAACIRHSLQNILADITARELERELYKDAEVLGLDIIRRNVRAMLMAKPVAERVLGIHPGYRTGCNLAALDENGVVLETTTVYPHPPQNGVEKAKETIGRLVEEHGLKAVIIGEATGAQETETLVSGMIADRFPDLHYTVVPETGIAAYAASRAAANEMPNLDRGVRSAVALGRRLQDPLSELVKINPRELCPTPYVDDVNGGSLKKLLDRIIEECVCQVGAEVNSAHYSLLRYVSGLGPEKALALVEFRDKNGAVRNRRQLLEVPKIDPDSFARAVGFLKVRDSDNPLDVTRIHPRFYPVAQRICEQIGMPLTSLKTDEGRAKLQEGRSDIKLADLEKEFDVHYLLLKEIIDEMLEPWPDPRRQEQGPVLRQRRLVLADLEPEQWLKGTVRNVVDFGVFVDIGVGEDGLVHISELSDKYVESPYDVVSVGDNVRVRVVRVDTDKGRIALSMRAESSRPHRAASSGPRRTGPVQRRRAERHVAADAGSSRRPHSPIQTPRSTLGWDSRRVQKAAMAERLSKTKQQILRKSESVAGSAEGEEQSLAPDAAKEPAPNLEGLLSKLDFGDIERRGETSD